MRQRTSQWRVLAAASLAAFMAAGTRANLSVFLKPLNEQFLWSRKSLSLAMSLQMLTYALANPFVGRLTDRYGAQIVLFLGSLGIGLAMVVLGSINELWQLHLLYGLAIGVSYAAAGTGPNVTMISGWFSQRRQGVAVGLGIAGASAGQLVLIPLATALILSQGWSPAYRILGLAVLAVNLPVIGGLVRSAPTGGPQRSMDRSIASTTFGQVATTFPFWIVFVSYLFSGFAFSLVLTHTVSYAIDLGIADQWAANLMGGMQALSIVGAITFGASTDRWGPRPPLVALYAIRFLAFAAIGFLPSLEALYAFAVIFGLTFVAPMAMLTALISQAYGQAVLGTLLGSLLLANQVGGAIGAYIGGWAFDTYGSYQLAFLTAGVLSLLAAVGIAAMGDLRRIPETQVKRDA